MIYLYSVPLALLLVWGVALVVDSYRQTRPKTVAMQRVLAIVVFLLMFSILFFAIAREFA